MKIVKKILLAIVIIIAIPLVIALFVKKEYTVEREVVINKPSQQVFNYVRMLGNQDHYNVWVMSDPNPKREYVGTDGTIGYILKWESAGKNAGKGEEEITAITEGSRIDIQIRFEKPMHDIADTYMSTEQVSGDQTKVKWSFHGKMSYPMNIMTLFIDKMLGKDMNTSLNNLKTALEQ